MLCINRAKSQLLFIVVLLWVAQGTLVQSTNVECIISHPLRRSKTLICGGPESVADAIAENRRRVGTKAVSGAKRRLQQRDNADSNDRPSGYECRLSPGQVGRYLENATRTWSFDDDALESVQNDLQMLINCTQNGDILLFNATQSIRPREQVTVPWPLTLSAAVGDGTDVATDDIFPLSQTTVRFTCPRDNEGLFLIQAENVTFANAIFERCYFNEEKGDQSIVDVAECTPGQSSRNIRLNHVSFNTNKLIGAVGLRIRSPSCSRVEMIDVTLVSNECFGRGCGARFASDNRLVNCAVSKNQLESSHSENPSVFYAPSGSRTEVFRFNASKNELTVFRVEGGSLSLTDSTFDRNDVDVKRDEDPFSPCIHLVDSSAVISDSAFRRNSGNSGSGVFAARSNVSASNTSFGHNSAEKDGGVLFLEDGSTATLDRCEFVKNTAEKHGGSLYLANSDAKIENSSFEKESADVGGSLYVETSSIEVTSSNFSTGSAKKGGCIAAEYSSQLILNDARVRACQALKLGGAVFTKSKSISRITDAHFESNSADEGGAFSVFDSEVTFQHIRAFNNTGEDVGGFVSGRDTSSIRVSNGSFEMNSGEYGGVLYFSSNSSAEFTDCQFSENTAKRSGGSVYTHNGTLVIHRTRFEDGVAENAGYISAVITRIDISNSSFERGEAYTSGGCVFVSAESDVSVRDTRFRSSQSGAAGAALYIIESTLIVQNSDFVDNFAKGAGGGIACLSYCRMNVSGTTFRGNQAISGGAFDLYQESTARLFQCEFRQNSATRGGGGSAEIVVSNATFKECHFSEETSQSAGGSLVIVSESAVNISASSFTAGKSESGGCLYVEMSTVDIRDTQLANCSASSGGALHVEDAIANVTNCSLVGNTASKDGGAVRLFSGTSRTELTITELNITENTAGRFGGGIASEQSTALRIFSSSFSRNSAREGGAIHQKATRNGLYTNVSFRYNHADDSGGAVYLSEHAAVFDRCDMEGNNATDGGSILLADDATVNITHSSFRRSEALQYGGAIMATTNSSVTVTDTTVEESRASERGGGIYSSFAKIEAYNLAVLRCQSDGEGGGFAGLQNSAFLCNDCVFEGNSAIKEGGAMSVRSSKERLVGVQLDNCRLRNNVANRGGGIHFVNEERGVDCTQSSADCSFSVLTGVELNRNEARGAGGGLFASDLNAIRLDCSPRLRRNTTMFYDRQELDTLKVISSKNDLCQSWSSNRAGIYGEDAGSYATDVAIQVFPHHNETVTRDGRHFEVEDHASGEPLPGFELKVVDNLGHWPAIGLNNETVEAFMTADGGFFSGSVNMDLINGTGNFTRVVGFGAKGKYRCRIEFSEESIEAIEIGVDVRGCRMGEVSAANGTVCELCSFDTYNLGEEGDKSCRPCPENADCSTHVILPEEGYWHRTPCSKKLQRCLTMSACDFKNRKDHLETVTENVERCQFNETFRMEYNEAQCKEGHTGPLCGSCTQSYGMSSSQECVKCASRYSSILWGFIPLVILMVLSAFSVRGNLNDSTRLWLSRHTGGGRQMTFPNANMASSAGQRTNEVSSGTVTPVGSGEPPPQWSVRLLSKRFCFSKEKSIEVFKIAVNFLQVTAAAISINADWTETLTGMFRFWNYLGGVTSEGVRISVDCIVKDDDASKKAIASVTMELVVPVVAICLYSLYWLYKKVKKEYGLQFFLQRTLLAVFAVLYIGYISITKSLVQILNCISVDDSTDGDEESSTKYWAANTNVECYTGTHAILAYFISWPFLVLFTVGFPVLLAVLTTNYVDQDYTDGWIYDIAGFLYRSYEKEYIFWESTVMTKKAFLAVVVVFSYPLGVTLQVVMAAFVLILSLYFQTTCGPYMELFDDLDVLESVSQLVSLLTLLSSLFFISDRVSSSVRVLLTVLIVLSNVGFLGFCLVYLFLTLVDHMKMVLCSEGLQAAYSDNLFFVFWIYLKDYKLRNLIQRVFQPRSRASLLSPQASENMSGNLQAIEQA